MKTTFSFLLLVSILFFSTGCVENILKSEWETYCDESALGGEINLTIDGKEWGTGCVTAFYTEDFFGDDSNNLLWIYAYNFNSTFYNTSDIEVFFASYLETTSSGVTETKSTAGFVDGFIINGQNTGEFGNSFSSDPDLTTTDNIIITELTSDMAKGTINFKLLSNEENSTEEISVTGSFEAVIER